MDKMCNKSGVEDLNKTIANPGETDNLKDLGSPVFKYCNNTKALKGSNLDSSDYDIPSYQVNQSIKSRTSSKYGNETSESVLPFTPIFSPIPIASSVQFQPPSIHSLGTVTKNVDKSCQSKISSSSNPIRVQTIKSYGAFESLGMTDKDISWVSSMATPPTKNNPGSEFNTVEKATFFPEEKFQNIQPRALFSPTLDDDSGCHPIIFTSESDDEEYKTNIRLSDVCATLKELEVRSLDQNNSLEKTMTDKDCIISPIIKTKRKKLRSVRKKKKGFLVISPENNDKYEFTVGENLKILEHEKLKSNNGSNFIEDDSFQSMSFSGIDELCKTFVTEQNTYGASKTGDIDKTVISTKENNILKKFYFTNTETDVYKISSMDNLHSYAKALEEGDKCLPWSCKTKQHLPQTGIIRFDILNKDISKIDGTKRSHSEITEGNEECKGKKLKKVEEENSGWENVKQYLSESQLNVSDGEIFRTVENLEKTLASQETKDSQKPYSEKLEGVESVSSQYSDLLTSSTETCGKSKEILQNKTLRILKMTETHAMVNNDAKYPDEGLPALPSIAFITAAGSKISVSEEALNKGRQILQDCNENLEVEKISLTVQSDMSDKQTDVLMKGFSTSSGKQIKVSADALKKARTFMSECENPDGEKFMNEMNFQCHTKLMGKSEENLMGGFLRGSGKQIQMSEEALDRAQAIMSEFNDATKEQFPGVKSAVEGFSTGSGKKIKISTKALKKAKAFMAEGDKAEAEVDSWFKNSKEDSKNIKTGNCDKSSIENPSKFTNVREEYSTSAANPLQISVTPSYDKKLKQSLDSFERFSTGSRKTIQASAEALENAKSLMKNYEHEFNEEFDGFATEWIIEFDKKASPYTVEDSGRGRIMGDKNEDLEFKASTADNKIEVSKKAVEKATEFWSNESRREMPGSSAFPQTELPLMGFVTAGGSKVIISETALAKAKERMNELDQIKLNDSGNFDTNNLKISMNNASEVPDKKTESENLNKMSITSESDDWNEIIPSWLHVYNTSPSIASERTELSPLICHEDGKSSKSDREYIIKSPVLGIGDRFHGRTKKRRLRFEDETKSQEKMKGAFAIPYKNSERKNGGKRTSTLTLDFSVPFKKMKFGEDVVGAVGVKAEREQARLDQEKSIKEKHKVKPLKGSHLRRKHSEKQMSWREAVVGSSPEVNSDEILRSFGICEDTLKINIENVLSYRFNGKNFFGLSCTNNTKGIVIGDECSLILDDDNKFGVEELKSAFLASPGVQPNLVPHEWVENHCKWIIWKLANYERCFPQYFGRKSLTPNNIMLQLKYRYDREIDRNERSALKKILEKDDTSIKRLVLCVCDIKKVTVGESMGYKLTLTDGWYSCPAQADPAMTRLIDQGKLRIGTKLLTQGATLVNCEQGVSPLEITEDIYLKISTNSTRRIRWDAKLGFQKNPKNFPISLGSILPQGGQISRIDVIIVRIYPTLYIEKTSDGHHVTRNRRAEEKADSEYRRFQEQRMEKICDEVQSEMRRSSNFDQKSNRDCVNNFEQDEDLHHLMEASSDPSVLKELISTEQRKLAEKLQSDQNDRFTRELREKIQKKMEKEKLNKRNVSEVLRAKIVDFRKPDFNNPAILSVWNLNEDLTALLSEGKVISIMNVTISNSSRIYKPLQINTTRQTQFKELVRSVKYPARKLTRLKEVSSKVCPAFEEVDIVGMVTLIRDVSYGSRLSQVIYMTDLEMNFVGVVFWGSSKDYGWENVLSMSSVVACSNLQWKKNYTLQDVPSLYVSENSVFTENPKNVHLKEEIERLKQNMPTDKTTFLSECEENLATKLEDSKWHTSGSKNSSTNDSGLRENSKSGVNGFESKPTASSTPIKPFSVRMDSEEADPSPIQKRIEKLQSYGEPPSLIPLLVLNTAKRKFKKKK